MAYELCGNCEHYKRSSSIIPGFCTKRKLTKPQIDVCEDFVMAPWIKDGKLISNPNKNLLQLNNQVVGHYIIRLCGNCDFWLPLISDPRKGFCQKYQGIYQQEKTCKSFTLSKNLAGQIKEVIEQDFQVEVRSFDEDFDKK